MNKNGFLIMLSLIFLTGCTRMDSYTCTIAKTNTFEKISVNGDNKVKTLVVTKMFDYLSANETLKSLELESVETASKFNLIKGVTYKYNFKNNIFNQIFTYDIEKLAVSDRKEIDFITSDNELYLDETVNTLVKEGYDCTKDN